MKRKIIKYKFADNSEITVMDTKLSRGDIMELNKLHGDLIEYEDDEIEVKQEMTLDILLDLAESDEEKERIKFAHELGMLHGIQEVKEALFGEVTKDDKPTGAE